jgi:hypothetical protein
LISNLAEQHSAAFVRSAAHTAACKGGLY